MSGLCQTHVEVKVLLSLEHNLTGEQLKEQTPETPNVR